MTVDLAANFKRQIDGGEMFDAALFSALTLDLLVKEGKIKADTRTPILSAGIGVAVRRGAPKPDIGSVEAFKRALLEAKSIAYLKEGPSGVYLAGLLQRLGIAEQLKAKSKLADSDRVSIMIANGEAELGVVDHSEHSQRSWCRARRSAAARDTIDDLFCGGSRRRPRSIRKRRCN